MPIHLQSERYDRSKWQFASMNRYTLNMHRIFIVVLLGILQFGSKSVVLADYCEPSEQPNIVVILCDDVVSTACKILLLYKYNFYMFIS